MAVKRIVPNIASDQLEKAKSFYAEGGSGTSVPDLSVEVDNFEEVLLRVRRSGFPIAYGPALEPWGVKRFFVRDLFGRILNILEH